MLYEIFKVLLVKNSYLKLDKTWQHVNKLDLCQLGGIESVLRIESVPSLNKPFPGLWGQNKSFLLNTNTNIIFLPGFVKKPQLFCFNYNCFSHSSTDNQTNW